MSLMTFWSSFWTNNSNNKNNNENNKNKNKNNNNNNNNNYQIKKESERLRKKKLQVFGNIGSGHHQTKEKKRVPQTNEKTGWNQVLLRKSHQTGKPLGSTHL